MAATREGKLIKFEGWDTNFRDGLQAPMWVRADEVAAVRQVVPKVCHLWLKSGAQMQANADATAFVKLLDA